MIFILSRRIQMDEYVGRIPDKKIKVDEEQIHLFFENRVKKPLFHRYNLVNYQDDNPELAIQRDRIEKDKILPFLKVNQSSKILDIGCGVGRWGDELTPCLENGIYVGVDYSDSLIKVAQKAAEQDNTIDKRVYCVGSFQKINEILENKKIKFKYDIIIINGVLMYINDFDLDKCIKNVTELSNNHSRIYIKESVGIEARLTLNKVYSKELTSDYSAIYRSVKEYEMLFAKYFQQFQKISSGETFIETELHNRKETTSYFWIYET